MLTELIQRIHHIWVYQIQKLNMFKIKGYLHKAEGDVEEFHIILELIFIFLYSLI